MNDEIDIGLEVLLLELESAAQLLEDFWNDLEKILTEERGDS